MLEITYSNAIFSTILMTLYWNDKKETLRQQ